MNVALPQNPYKMFKSLLSNSRYLVLIAVLGLLTSFLSLMVSGVLKIVKTITLMLGQSGDSKMELIGFIESADLFLLAVAMYIMALGLYDLFIDSDVPMPEWLNIKNLTDLKKKLLDVVVIILGVVFLGKVVNWKGEVEILHFGAGIALVIGALTWFRNLGKSEKGEDRN